MESEKWGKAVPDYARKVYLARAELAVVSVMTESPEVSSSLCWTEAS